MSNNGNNGKGSSMAIGVIAFAIIVAIIVIFFTISANSNGGSPAKPVGTPEAVTEVADNESSDSSSSDLDVDTEDDSDVEESTEAEDDDETADEEVTEAEDDDETADEETEEESNVECPNCKKMVSNLQRFKPTEDYDFFKLWCADCRAEVEDGTNSVDNIDFDSDVDCDGCGETFSKHTDKNSIKNNGLCPDCYDSYQATMEDNGIDVL